MYGNLWNFCSFFLLGRIFFLIWPLSDDYGNGQLTATRVGFNTWLVNRSFNILVSRVKAFHFKTKPNN